MVFGNTFGLLIDICFKAYVLKYLIKFLTEIAKIAKELISGVFNIMYCIYLLINKIFTKIFKSHDNEKIQSKAIIDFLFMFFNQFKCFKKLEDISAFNVMDNNSATQTDKFKNKIQKEKINDEKLLILNHFFEQNADSKIDNDTLVLLAAKTKLSLKQVTNWLYYKKNKYQKEKTSENQNRITFNQKIILKNHFIYVNTKPSVNEVELLEEKTGLPKKKIIRWFYKQKHLLKKNQFNIL